ncbi:transcriptional regulator [Acinetobacter chinensis]|jgi:DNA-binding IclR family transcriptional regulator|uniref:HTH-type transcriptional repressor AllR n=1 Tax=Acinetobacter chinensis TaxID=2004650 RepID=A0A3B7LRX8_9GAMM|nr:MULTISPECIES: IclR family transcriptional regulator C-terminal domain-containing protein [Acinetobacter]AXY55552.1 transcriptional regulator [Acinetobacter chinensis]AXY61342.1 transcriptional regulator [Acinetobacter sp. WCHAc010052]MDV2469581.1 IclR family transcriptional regulator C-terminal domain-containing protein [Acinetobacter chinensis]WOE41883.1 IclR family transcriptional regulator C-terminal domain-containing protein [Acinetobacter chinensis]
MALSSFGKILTVLDLFSVSRPIINVDTISEELGLSKPTSYRYLKELVSADILQRLSGTSGDYTLGPKIAVMDYISRTTDPLVQISIPFMQEISEKTELCCLLTHLNTDYCIDIHHEVFKDVSLLSYGRGCPRPVFMGSSPKVIMAHLPKQKIHDYYQRFATELKNVGFAQDEDAFVQHMKKIKKQGYYLSRGELDPNVSGLSVPVKFSSKEAPLALTVLASKNRFEFINTDKLIEILKDNAAQIEKRFISLSETHQLPGHTYSISKSDNEQ